MLSQKGSPENRVGGGKRRRVIAANTPPPSIIQALCDRGIGRIGAPRAAVCAS
jgi:hypothetical protein